MSGFLVSSPKEGESVDAAEARNRKMTAAFERKGMRMTHLHENCGVHLYLFSNESHDPAKALSRGVAGTFCTYVGTMLYRGRTGSDATALILDDLESGRGDCIDAAIGNFCLLIGDREGLRMATDRAGLHHVYHDDDLSLICNSFVAAACGCRTQTPELQEVLEYVLLGATFGPNSLVKEVRLLGSECEVRISGQRRRVILQESVWNARARQWKDATLAERIEHAIEVADDYYGQIARSFGEKVTGALSGGYDSRLNLALMRRHGITPALFVYGGPHDPDVQIAQLICRSEALELQHIDRDSRPPLDPAEYWRNQEDVFHGLDGMTQNGFACEPYEVSHRRERVAGGLLALNGGGGEIWRDFWKLPDKAMRPVEFVRAYFGGRFHGLACGKATDQFLLALSEKVHAIAATGTDRMPSAVVQSLYARMRLRYWQGKNNTVDNHIGYALTPFSEHQFSVPAMWIPMRAKRDGWFERQLIRRTSPRLASYPSCYGYDLNHGPPFLKRVRASLTCRTPIWLRIMRRRARSEYHRSRYHTDRYLRVRFGAGPLEVEQFVQLSELRDPLAFSRALTVERLLRGEWLCD